MKERSNGFFCIYHLFLTCIIFKNASANSIKKDNKLLLFLLDGFRWDYFDRQEINLPGFKRMIKEGAKAEYLQPDFPSLSYPNYYSIMTGLHCEDHGMVGNYMFDVRHNESFLIGTNPEQYHAYWWDDGEPLWVTAEKQGKQSYFYSWPGCEVTIRGVVPTYCKKYPVDSYPKLNDMQAAIAESLELFSNGSADVVGIYVELPDKYGHKYGPSSSQVNQNLMEIDTEMDKFLDELETRDLRDDVNIMIFSDHGMTEVSETRVINITDYVEMEDIRVILDKAATVYIWPNTGKLDKVYSDLVSMNNPHMTVYKKEDIPDRWHYRNHYRTPPILLVAEKGWYITTPLKLTIYSYPDSGTMLATHGFDNYDIDMRGIFLATGPDISRNVVVKGFSVVHIYQMMCDVLGITPNPNEGIYVELPDKYGHKYGPSSSQLNEKLMEIDTEMDKLLDELESRDLRDDVNIMIFSDHGMTEVRETRVINITDYVEIEDIRVVLDAGANVYIWLNAGKLDKVYSDLVSMNNPHVTVYKKEDILDRWYYRDHYRLPPLSYWWQRKAGTSQRHCCLAFTAILALDQCKGLTDLITARLI